mgnify:CR=1 FL=1
MKIVFLINGLGLGNSTRCHAIIEQLVKKKVEVFVISSGNGLWYFNGISQISKVFEIQALYYGSKNGKIDILSTIKSIGSFIKISRNNSKKIFNILYSIKPDLVISDSVYTYKPMRKLKIPLLALNNSDMVCKAYKWFGDAPMSVKAQFYLVEKMDFLYHKLIPDLVISPTLMNFGETNAKFKKVGPIVRMNCKVSKKKNTSLKVAVMLSGSTFGSPVIFSKNDYGFQIDVLGRPFPKDWRGAKTIKYHGKTKDSQSILKSADLMVVNGGFSAVSEAFVMRKPVIVIPVPNHAEQWVNARTIMELGVGEIATEENFVDKMLEMITKLSDYTKNYLKFSGNENSALQSAKIIMDSVVRK